MLDWALYVRQNLQLSGLEVEREAEVIEDLAEQLEDAYAEALQRGLSPSQAEAAAKKHIADWPTLANEVGRSRRGRESAMNAIQTRAENRSIAKHGEFSFFTGLMQDMHYGFRMLRKSPGFAAVAVFTLALGIGANATIFSMVDGLLLRPMPVRAPGELVALNMKQDGQPLFLSYPDFRDIRGQTSSIFSGSVAFTVGLDGLSVEGRSDRVITNYVSGNCFTTLGLKPALGRLFLPSEGEFPGTSPVLVLGYSYWKVHFAGNPNIVGQQALVDGRPVTIVGVAPKGFQGLQWPLDVQAYLPLNMMTASGYHPKNFMADRGYTTFSNLARLRSGISLERAETALQLVAARLAQAQPKSDRNIQLTLMPETLARLGPGMAGPVVSVATFFLTLAILVVLLACINVAGVVLARALVRQREMALRTALGATRFRLVRQLVVETVLIGLAGGFVGVLAGVWIAARIGAVNFHAGVPLNLGFRPDWRVFAYGLAVALLSGLAVGIVPAFRASSANLNEVLHEGGQQVASGRQRVRSALVIAEVAGSLTLLVVAGSFVRSLGNAGRVNLGFDPHHVVTVTMDPREVGYTDGQGQEFYSELLRRVRALPGVQSASESCCVPLGQTLNSSEIVVPGYQPPPGQPAPSTLFSDITPGYFRTLGIPILRGRSFTEADDAHSQPVAVVNQAMANKFWPKQDPIGQHFALTSKSSTPGPEIEVVGIAKNGKYQSVLESEQSFFYLPLAQRYLSLGTLVVRTSLPPATMLGTLRGQIAALAPGLPIFGAQTMDQSVSGGLLILQLAAALSGTLGFLGLVLGVIGVYGVVSNVVSQKTHEIGVRMAIGARPGQVRWMILRQGFVLVSGGVALGLLLSLAAARVVGEFLVGVSGNDPFTLAGASVLLGAVVLAACYIPAHRAMRVDPMVALKYE